MRTLPRVPPLIQRVRVQARRVGLHDSMDLLAEHGNTNGTGDRAGRVGPVSVTGSNERDDFPDDSRCAANPARVRNAGVRGGGECSSRSSPRFCRPRSSRRICVVCIDRLFCPAHWHRGHAGTTRHGINAVARVPTTAGCPSGREPGDAVPSPVHALCPIRAGGRRQLDYSTFLGLCRVVYREAGGRDRSRPAPAVSM